MNKIFIVCEGNWQDYEGGGDAIVAVFTDRDAAVSLIKAQWPDYKLDKYDANQWNHPSSGPEDQVAGHYWVSIQEFLVDVVVGQFDPING